MDCPRRDRAIRGTGAEVPKGTVKDTRQRAALWVATENIPGVKRVVDDLPTAVITIAPQAMSYLWLTRPQQQNHGADATSCLAGENGHLTADLVTIRQRFSDTGRPPRLTVYATGDKRPLVVEFTVTFPHVGRLGSRSDK